MNNIYNGFKELEKEFEGIIAKAEEPEKILEIGVKEFVTDLRKLPKPISKIRKSGYTHLIDTFSYKKNNNRSEIEVGWGKYYGPMVEHGTENMNAKAHLEPCFERNKEKYYNKMIKEIF